MSIIGNVCPYKRNIEVYTKHGLEVDMWDITPAVKEIYLKVYRAKGNVPVNPWISGSLISGIYNIQVLLLYYLRNEFLRCIIMKNIQLTTQNCCHGIYHVYAKKYASIKLKSIVERICNCID